MKGLIFFNRKVNRIYFKIGENARAHNEFGCSSTPAPTPPVSSTDSRKAGVGAGLYNNQVGAGVRMEEVKIKGESQNQSQKQNQHHGKPPDSSLSGRAGFSTPFPEGLIPSGSLIFLTSISGGNQ
jgi:hypothetical protein